MEKIIITGATGAIGRALISQAVQAGYEVLAVVHRSSKRIADLERLEHCSVLRLDQEEYAQALPVMQEQGIPVEGYSMFFHLAWSSSYGEGRNNLHHQAMNVRAAMDAVRMARLLGCGKFVGTGSQAEYGRVEGTLRPDTPANPETGYGSGKYHAGNLTRIWAQKEGMKHIWTRILSVYGPYDRPETLISTAVSRMLRNEDTAFSPCEQIWDYLYSGDAARALLLAAEKGISGKTYVIGSGTGRPLRWYIEKIAEVTGYTKEIGFGKRPYNDKQVMHLVADIRELTEDTGFTPEVGFEDGIRRVVKWLE